MLNYIFIYYIKYCLIREFINFISIEQTIIIILFTIISGNVLLKAHRSIFNDIN